MYDRYEGNLWQQISGEAIVGPAAVREEFLEPLVLLTLTWDEALLQYPESLVLSRPNRGNYQSYPYGDYETNPEVYDHFIDPAKIDERFHSKSEVYGFEVAGQAAAVFDEALVVGNIISERINGVSVRIEKFGEW